VIDQLRDEMVISAPVPSATRMDSPPPHYLKRGVGMLALADFHTRFNWLQYALPTTPINAHSKTASPVYPTPSNPQTEAPYRKSMSYWFIGIGLHDPTWIPTMIQPLALALGFDPNSSLPAPEKLPNKF
jgi:hypothetical protein